jgi:hypothetical protein
MTTNQSNDRTTVFLCGFTGSRIITAADGRTRRRWAERNRAEAADNKAPLKKSQGFGKMTK